MPFRPQSFVLFVVVAALAAAPAALAQPRPGVGYDPQARGLSISRYQLDTLTSPFLSYKADFSARPDLVGAHPNPYDLDFSDATVREAIERRWGPGTASDRFKRWAGPGNEVRFLVREALAWAWAKRPDLLGGDRSNRNGEPTEVEITDVQAFNDRDLWITYFQAELTGFSPERRAVICDPGKPSGDGEEIQPFWGIPYYFHNKYKSLPVSPQLPASIACAGKN
ncbi:MAG TPA: hypothetical protein VGG03_21105 [Thermoanaerobaculia bacterium]|jgi:hypothetical protein